MSSGGLAGICFILGAGFAIVAVLLYYILTELRKIVQLLQKKGRYDGKTPH